MPRVPVLILLAWLGASTALAIKPIPPVVIVPTPVIPENGRVLVIGHGALAEKMGRATTARLVGEQTLSLTVEPVQRSDQNAQLLLVPEEPLTQGTVWSLQIEGVELEGFEGKQWSVGPADETPPTWSTAPTVGAPFHRFRETGIGVTTPARDDGEMVLIEVRAVPDEGPEARWFEVGSGADGAAFDVLPTACQTDGAREQGRCMLHFTAVDLAGNRTPAPGIPLELSWSADASTGP